MFAQQPADKSEFPLQNKPPDAHLVLLFIDPNPQPLLADGSASFGLYSGLSFEIKAQTSWPRKRFMAGIYELASAEKSFNAGFALSFRPFRYPRDFLLFSSSFCFVFFPEVASIVFREGRFFLACFSPRKACRLTYQRGDPSVALQIEKRVFLSFPAVPLFADFPGNRHIPFAFFFRWNAGQLISFILSRRFLGCRQFPQTAS